MELSDIIVKSLKYPLDDEGFYYVIILCSLLAIALIVFWLFAGIGVAIGTNTAGIMALVGLLIVGLLVLAFALIAPGYAVSVMSEGIDQTGVIPAMDIGKNIVDSIKLFVIHFIYAIIPVIFTLIVGVIAGLLGVALTPDTYSHSSHYYSSYSNYSDPTMLLYLFVFLLVGIVSAIFTLLSMVGMLRFAKYDSLSEAVNFSEVVSDLKEIGIVKTIVFYVALVVIATILCMGFVGLLFIPLGIFAIILILFPFLILFNSYALGLLYSEVA